MESGSESLKRWEPELFLFGEDYQQAQSPKIPEMDEIAHEAPPDSQMWQMEVMDVQYGYPKNMENPLKNSFTGQMEETDEELGYPEQVENPLWNDFFMGCPCPCDDQVSPCDDQASAAAHSSEFHNYAAPAEEKEPGPACPVSDADDEAVELLLTGQLTGPLWSMITGSPLTLLEGDFDDETEVGQEQDVAAQVTTQQQDSMQPAVPQMQSAVLPQRSTPVPQSQAAVSQKSTPAAKKQTPSQRPTPGAKRQAPPPKRPAAKRPTPGPNRPTPFSEWHPAAVKQPAAAATTVDFPNIDAMSASAVHTVSGTMYHQRSLTSRLPAAQTSNAPKRRGRPPANPGLEHDYSRRPPQRPTGRRAAPKKTRVPKTTKSPISKAKHNENERQRRAHLRDEVTRLQSVVREGSELGPEVHKKLSQSKTLVCAARAIAIIAENLRQVGLNPNVMSQQHWE